MSSYVVGLIWGFFSSHNRGNSNTSKFKSHRYGCLFQSFPTTSNRKYQLIAFDGLVIYTLRHIFSVISSVVFASAYIFLLQKSIHILQQFRLEELFQLTNNKHTQKLWRVDEEGEREEQLFWRVFSLSVFMFNGCSVSFVRAKMLNQFDMWQQQVWHKHQVITSNCTHKHTRTVFCLCRLLWLILIWEWERILAQSKSNESRKPFLTGFSAIEKQTRQWRKWYIILYRITKCRTQFKYSPN